MGFSSHPRVPWPQLRRQMTGQPVGGDVDPGSTGCRRDGYTAPEDLAGRFLTSETLSDRRVLYAELHWHSNFSFLDGASQHGRTGSEAPGPCYQGLRHARVPAGLCLSSCDQQETPASQHIPTRMKSAPCKLLP